MRIKEVSVCPFALFHLRRSRLRKGGRVTGSVLTAGAVCAAGGNGMECCTDQCGHGCGCAEPGSR